VAGYFYYAFGHSFLPLGVFVPAGELTAGGSPAGHIVFQLPPALVAGLAFVAVTRAYTRGKTDFRGCTAVILPRIDPGYKYRAGQNMAQLSANLIGQDAAPHRAAWDLVFD
jgi:hypothetical protein